VTAPDNAEPRNEPSGPSLRALSVQRGSFLRRLMVEFVIVTAVLYILGADLASERVEQTLKKGRKWKIV